MKSGAIFGALVGSIILTSLLGLTTSGFPTTPVFQDVGVGRYPVHLASSARVDVQATGAAGVGQVLIRGASTATAGICTSDTVSACDTGAPANGLDLFGAANGLTYNGISIAPADSGTLTWSMTLANSTCSVAGGSTTFVLHKIGKVVTGMVTSGATCTIASGTQVTSTNTPVPALYRPVAASSCGATTLLGSTVVPGQICVTNAGDVALTETSGSAVTTLGTQSRVGFTYTLD